MLNDALEVLYLGNNCGSPPPALEASLRPGVVWLWSCSQRQLCSYAGGWDVSGYDQVGLLVEFQLKIYVLSWNLQMSQKFNPSLFFLIRGGGPKYYYLFDFYSGVNMGWVS